MRIGITGASGFLGAAFGRLAAERGHEIVAYSRSGHVTGDWVRESRKLDADKSIAIDASGCDALAHLAGESVFGLWTPQKKRRIRDSRVDLTRKIVTAMESAQPAPRILASASGVGFYGDRADEILDESSPKGRGFLSDVCEDWEAAACEAGRIGARVVLLRTGLVLGRGGGAFPLLRKVFGAGLGGRLGSGRQWMPWIHVNDHAGMLLWAIENSVVSGPLNFVSPNPVTNAELTGMLARLLQRPAFFHAPEFALRLTPGGMAAEMFLCSQRALPQAARNAGYTFQYSNLEKALSDLISS